MPLIISSGITIGGGVTISSGADPVGDIIYDVAGTYSWTAPEGVTSVCVVCVGGGGGKGGAAFGLGGEIGRASCRERVLFAV